MSGSALPAAHLSLSKHNLRSDVARVFVSKFSLRLGDELRQADAPALGSAAHEGNGILDMQRGGKYFGFFETNTLATPVTLRYRLIDDSGTPLYDVTLNDSAIGLP